MSEGVLTDKQLKAPANVSYKPDTKSRKTQNVERYVTKQDPTKKASLNVVSPGK